jgi:hypothetical protein
MNRRRAAGISASLAGRLRLLIFHALMIVGHDVALRASMTCAFMRDCRCPRHVEPDHDHDRLEFSVGHVVLPNHG